MSDVSSVEAFQEHPERVLNFYNDLRREMKVVEPNVAHHALADLESRYTNVTIVTQNVDNLHERSGASQVLHLHGDITKKFPSGGGAVVDCDGDILLGDLSPFEGKQYRPHVVFFGESTLYWEEALEATRQADVLLVVGTSLSVWPAAHIVAQTMAKRVYFVGPVEPDLGDVAFIGLRRSGNYEVILAPATEGVPEAIQRINDYAESRGTCF